MVDTSVIGSLDSSLPMEEVVKYLRALLALQVRALSLSAGDQPPKPEVMLATLGFTAREISLLTGKSLAAVAKAITRSRSSGENKESKPDE